MNATNLPKNFRNQTNRYRFIGLAVLAGTLGAILLCAWIWWQVNYEGVRRFSIYFDNNVQNLSSGSDVIFDGVKIGQIQQIKIQTSASENEPDQAVVIVGIDATRASKRFAFPPELRSREELEKYVKKMAERGLRSRILRPSATASGDVIELYFAPNERARWSSWSNPKNPPELPHGNPRAPGSMLDMAMRVITQENAGKFVEKVNAAHAQILHFIEEFDALDFAKINEKAVAKTDLVARLLDDKKFLPRIRELNNLLGEIDEKIIAGTPISAAEFENLNASLRDFQLLLTAGTQFLSHGNANFFEKQREFSENLERVRERLLELKRSIESRE